LSRRRLARFAAAAAVAAAATITPIELILTSNAGAQDTTYAALGAPQLATITNGASAAPWNEYEGDTGSPVYSSSAPGAVLPVYETGGATTTTANGVSGANVTEPNLSVVPSSSSTAGVAPYPSGVVGTPGPLDGYCGSGTNPTEQTGSPSRQPASTTLPLAPAYFPHIIRNADGSLTGYFDYRPKDADEALLVATSTDNGVDWTYDGEALEQNSGYCPTGDINDDGQGHANILTIGGNTYLYTLPRAAGDMQGVGMIVHQFNPTESNPLGSGTVSPANPVGQLPASEKSGIDPDGFATVQSSPIPTSGGVSVTLTTTGSANSTEQLVTGGFVDLSQDPNPGPSNVISCTVTTGSNTMTGCTSPTSITVNAGDLIEQVIGYVSAQATGTIPTGSSQNTAGTGGLGTIDVSPTPSAAAQTSGSSNLGFTLPLTGSTFNANAPNRLYINGTNVYCTQSNNNPTTKIEDCTTGPGGLSLTTAAGQVILSDPVIPATAYETDPSSGGMTAGLVAPDGIVGTVPSYPETSPGAVPAGATYVMYTEKELNYYLTGDSTNAVTMSSSTGQTIDFIASPYIAQNMPSPSSVTVSNPVDVTIGLTTTSSGSTGNMIPVTCTSLTEAGASSTLGGCTIPSSDTADTFEQAKTYIGAPGAATVAQATLALTGEGSASNVVKLYKNNEDVSILRVAWTTDGTTFNTTGLVNNGIVSDCVNTTTGIPEVTGCTSPYTGVNNPATNTSPSNLNAYANNDAANDTGTGSGTGPGTDLGSQVGGDADEMRWVGSAGSIVTNPDGTFGLFLSGAWAADGDSDAFNQIFYSTSTDGENWSVPTPVISTDYSFSASYAQDHAGSNQPIGISAYYEGRAYGPSVVQNPNGTLTMVFAGYRFPKAITNAGTVLGTGAQQWTVGTNDLSMYRNIMAVTLSSSTATPVTTTTTMTTPPTSPTVVGQTESVSATVAPVSPGTGTSTGTVTFEGTNQNTLCTASLNESTPDTASCTYTYSGPLSSPDSVTASYGGDSNYATSTSSATSVTVNQDDTTTSTPASSVNPAVVGEQISLSSTVSVNSPGSGSPTGTVTFADGAGTLCTATLNQASPDAASCNYTYTGSDAAGDAITATYGGDTNDQGSTSSATLTETINTDPTTTTYLFSPSSPVTGQSVTFTATVAADAPGSGNPNGSVSFNDGGGTVCSSTLSDSSPDTASCSVPYSAVTMDTVTAAYGGDANYDASSSTSSTVTVGQASTSTTVVPSPASPVVGQPVTYTATVSVTSPGAGTPTGTVSFQGDAGALCTAPSTLNGLDTAACTTTYTGITSDFVMATYNADTNFSGSSGTTSITVDQAATTTTVVSSGSPSVAGQSVTYTATVSVNSPGSGTPTGEVSFAENGTTSCSNEPLSASSPYTATCTTPYTGATTDSVIASYGGDTNFSGSSSSSLSQQVNDAATTTTVAPSSSSVVVGQSVTYTATVTVNAPGTGTPTGDVSFAENGTSACSDQPLTTSSPYTASCTTAYTSAQADSVTATYSGNTTLAGSTSSPALSESIGKASTSTALASSTSSPVTGQPVTFTATVSVLSPGTGAPAGSVTFADTSGTLCSNVPLAGSSPYTAGCVVTYNAAEADSVTATYNGNGGYATSSSAAVPEQVTKATTTTTLMSSADPGEPGEAVTFTVTVSPEAPSVSSPAGNVTFAFSQPGGTTPLACTGGDSASLSGGSATCTLAEGDLQVGDSPLEVTATYAGDAADGASSASPLVESVGGGSSTTTITSTVNPSTGGDVVKFDATVAAVAPASGTPSGSVTFLVRNAAGQTIACKAGDTAPVKATGIAKCAIRAATLYASGSPYTVIATYDGSGQFGASTSAPFSQTVGLAPVTVTVASSNKKVAPGTAVTLTATLAPAVAGGPAPTGSVTFTLTGPGSTTISCTGGDTQTLSGTTATCQIAAGMLTSTGAKYKVPVQAAYSGDDNYATGESATFNQKVLS
jgi:hypothetical protein